jgi:signal peptidase I
MNTKVWKYFFSILSFCFLGLVIIAVLLRAFFLESHIVSGGSMEDELVHGDYILSWRLDPSDKTKLHYRDIVVIQLEKRDDHLIKRIIGLPGDTIELRSDSVLLNGRLLEEKYVKIKKSFNRQTYHLKEGQIFVLGDNRAASRDSKDFGPVLIKNVEEKAFLVYYPFHQIKWLLNRS